MRRDNIENGTPHCRDHCRGCGCHFRSTAAFDYHRVGSIPRGTRRCRAPEQAKRQTGEPRLEIVTTEGACTLSGAKMKNVTIWREV